MKEVITTLSSDELKDLMVKAIREAHGEIINEVPHDELWDSDQAVERLKVSKVTLWKKRKSGDLPYYQIGKRILYKPEELLMALKKHMSYGKHGV